jgi:hypothetical protein
MLRELQADRLQRNKTIKFRYAAESRGRSSISCPADPCQEQASARAIGVSAPHRQANDMSEAV